MSRGIYIRHEDLQNPDNGEAYFGPFDENEIDDRLNDAYSDLLSGVGNVDCVLLDEYEKWKCNNSRDYWMTQLAKAEGREDIRTKVTEHPLPKLPTYRAKCCRVWDLLLGNSPGRCGICKQTPERL